MHPKDRYPRLTRREFLRRATAAGVAVPGFAAILAACGGDGGAPAGGGGTEEPALRLASPENPVTLPLVDDNPPIADGLAPEGGPLKIFGYNDYIWKKVRNGFAEAFNTEIEYTVFDTPEEMVAKVQTGADFDLIVTVTIENIGKLAAAGLIQPLNQSYLPNVSAELWPDLPDFYDVGRRYSVPYVQYTTGIAWRNDLVSDDIAAMDNPYDVYWDTRFARKTHLLNGARDALSVGLLRKGYSPVESDPAILDEVKQDMLEGAESMGWQYDHVDYTELATSEWEVHNTWSGQMVYYQYYLPKDVGITDLSYLWPPHGAGGKPGLISHDLFAIPKAASNPVLAHELINHLYDIDVALQNYTYEGYQPTLTSFDVDLAVSEGYLPESLDYTFVTPDMLAQGVTQLELEPAVNQLYQQIYQEITGGA